MSAARAAVDADSRAVAVPRRRFRFQPADAVVRVLNARRIRSVRRQRHVDGDDEHAARGERTVHRFLGVAVLCVPRAAVQIDHGRKRSGTLRLIHTRHQHSSRGVAAELDVVYGDVELRRRIVSRLRGRSCLRGHRRDRPDQRQARSAERRHRHQEAPTRRRVLVHADLLGVEVTITRAQTLAPTSAAGREKPSKPRAAIQQSEAPALAQILCDFAVCVRRFSPITAPARHRVVRSPPWRQT